MSIGRQERFGAEQAPDRPPIGGTGEPITAPPGAISCCICLNQRGKRLPATTIVSGYAVCDEHVELAGAPGFSIHKIRGEQRAT